MKCDPGSCLILRAIAAAVTAEELRLEALGEPGRVEKLLADAKAASDEAKAHLSEVCKL